MPIASIKPGVPTTPTIQPTAATPPDYRGVVVDNFIKPVESLLSYVSGYPWTINYYRQLVGEHNNIREIDLTAPDLYQSYEKIEGLEIRVQSPLQDSYDAETGITTYTGSAVIYAFIIPNTFDYFIADAGNSRYALFKVTNVERNSVRTNTVWTVEYCLIGYLDTRQDIYDALTSRTVATLHFDKERILDGNNPLLRDDVYALLKNCKANYGRVLGYYIEKFYSSRNACLAIPNQIDTIYDFYLNSFILKIIGMDEAPEITYLRDPEYDGDEVASQPTIWDALLKRESYVLNEAVTDMTLVRRQAFSRNPHLKGIFLSGMDYIVYPNSKDASLLEYRTAKEGADMELDKTLRSHRQLSQVPSYTYQLNSGTVPTIPVLNTLDSYVLPVSFYTDPSIGNSVLEILVKDYLNKAAISLTMLDRLTNDFFKWERQEQFYYGPIILLLIRTVITEAY